MTDYETEANLADMYDNFDPNAPAFTKPARTVEEQKARIMDDKTLKREVNWIQKALDTDESICDYIGDALCMMEMSTAMARQVIKEIAVRRSTPLNITDYLESQIEEGEATGW